MKKIAENIPFLLPMKNFKRLTQKKFSKDFIWSLISLGIISIAGILINIVIGNFYDTEGLGTYSFAFSIYMLSATLSIFGLKSSATKHTGEFVKSEKERILSMKATLMIVSLFSIAVTGILFLFYKLGGGGVNFRDSINILVALPLYTINEVLFGYLNGLRKMKLYALLRTLRWLLIIALISLCIWLKLTVKQALFSFPIAEVVITLTFIWIIKKELFKYNKNLKHWIKKHLSFGSKIILTDIVNQLNSRLSIILLGLFLTKSDIGIFSFASTISSGLLMIPGTVALNFNPIIADLWKNNKEKLDKYITQVKKWTLLITLPLFGIAAIAYPLLIKLFMKGKGYDQSIPIFYILLLGNISLTLVYWASGLLTMAGFPQVKLKARTILLFINVLLSIILINFFGILGAAVATTLTNVVWTGIVIIIIKRKLNLKLI